MPEPRARRERLPDPSARHRRHLGHGPATGSAKSLRKPEDAAAHKNRLRKLGYEIRSVELAGGGRWRIELVAGQTIYFREGGEISLGWGPRDYRLERLFKIEPPQERVARPFPVRRVR